MPVKKNILVAYLPNPKDLGILAKHHWYRIPASTKLIPRIVKEDDVRLIAFYQPKIFEKDAFAVRWYGKVKKIDQVRRSKLFPKEPRNEKSDNVYYKIRIEKLLRLPRAIFSQRHRRILFITTTLTRLKDAEEINDLFFESPIEELLWKKLRGSILKPERQYLETVKKRNFYLDFAVFCRNSKLDIECDGDTYHMEENAVRSDKKRDNILESKGWNVLRYTTEDLLYHLDDTVAQIKETVNTYGGVEDPEKKNNFNYLPSEEEDSLFSNFD